MMMKFGWKLFVDDAEEEVGRCRSGLEVEDEDEDEDEDEGVER